MDAGETEARVGFHDAVGDGMDGHGLGVVWAGLWVYELTLPRSRDGEGLRLRRLLIEPLIELGLSQSRIVVMCRDQDLEEWRAAMGGSETFLYLASL